MAMVDLKPTLLWWVLTRYHVWAIGSALLAVWGTLEGSTAGDVVGAFLMGVHGLVWWQSHRHRERVRGYIRRRVEDAEAQWKSDSRYWVMPMSMIEFHAYKAYQHFVLAALNAALRRPDLWGKWMLNVYCGETSVPFASGCDSWPRWVWEPVKG